MTEVTPRGPTSAAAAASAAKVAKQKPNPAPAGVSNVAFGCEHTQAFYKQSPQAWKTLASQYSTALKSLNSSTPIKPQTIRVGKDKFRTSLRPSYLCLQCPTIFTEEGMRSHFEGPKAHSLYVESRAGSVFCVNCEDFIYDPTLERLRLSSTAMQNGKKRKFDEYSGVGEANPLLAAHSAFVPCRAIGLRGLYNMGNTCFMSVVIQSLLHNPIIKAHFLSEGHAKSTECERDNHACTSCALEDIFMEFWSGEKTEGYGAVPMLLSSWKSAEHLAGYQQQDAHEYMQFILNSLHSTNKPGVEGEETQSEHSNHDDCDCIIHRTFYGKLQSTVTCNECKNKTTALDPFMDLSLDLRSQVRKRKLNGVKKDKEKDASAAKADDSVPASTGEDKQEMKLEECLSRFTGEEKLAKEDYRCVKCERQRDATKQLSIRKLPPVLSVHLKRFSHTKDKSSKLETPVHFPLVADMLPFTTTSIDRKSSKPNGVANAPRRWREPVHSSARYELSAVIVHKGEINSGHYVSYAREGRDWFLFDDSKVVLVGEAEVLAAQAYLLVYVAARI